MDAVVASVLFKTQLLHDPRHFVQSSLALDYSVKVSFSIVPLFFFVMRIRVTFSLSVI